MNARITQSYWNQYRVAPAKPADKPRKEKEQTKPPLTKAEKKILGFLAGYVLVIVVVQVLIHIKVIAGPGYL